MKRYIRSDLTLLKPSTTIYYTDYTPRKYYDYCVYEVDPESGYELDCIERFSSSQLKKAIRYAQKDTQESGLFTHIVAVPDDDYEDQMRQDEELDVPEPFSIVWQNYEEA